MLPPDGRPLALHPALLLAQGVASVYNQRVTQAPVIIPLKVEDLAIGPGEDCIRTGRQSGEEQREWFGVAS